MKFRGITRRITMLLAASAAIADVVAEPNPLFIVPSVFDSTVAPAVASAVRRVSEAEGQRGAIALLVSNAAIERPWSLQQITGEAETPAVKLNGQFHVVKAVAHGLRDRIPLQKLAALVKHQQRVVGPGHRPKGSSPHWIGHTSDQGG